MKEDFHWSLGFFFYLYIWIRTLRYELFGLAFNFILETKSMAMQYSFIHPGSDRNPDSSKSMTIDSKIRSIVYYTKKIEDNRDNLRNTWKVLKKVINRNGKCNLVNKITVNNTEITNKHKISDEMNKYFASTGNNLAKGIPEGNLNPISLVKQSQSTFRFEKITPIQIHNLIMKSANGKAARVHVVSNPLLKTASPIISSQLADIFNQCIEHGTFSNDLKIGKVIPIFKSGEKDDPGNYHPTSILSAFARIFEKLLYQQLYKFFADNRMLGDKQWGFRSLHSTIHALQKAVDNWLLNIDKGNTNAVIFLGLRKAFDKVDHNILLKKLSCYGLKGKELSLMHSYLSNRSQCCRMEGMVSDFIPITCGVPQGSILGPLLFIIYVNILQDVTRSGDLSMYADDTHITSALKQSSDLNTAEILPEFIKICDWLQANKLSLNVVKTEYMIIGTEQSIIQLGLIPKIKVVNTYLKKVNKTKSQGLIID